MAGQSGFLSAVTRVVQFVFGMVKQFGRWWLKSLRARRGRSRSIFLLVSLVVACFVCAIPVAVFSPDREATPEPEAVAGERGQAVEVVGEGEEEPTPSTEPQDTKTPQPTDTPEATNTPAATDTPRPPATFTAAPTDIPRPSATFTAAPTNTPVPPTRTPTVPADTPTTVPTTAAPTDTAVPPTSTPVILADTPTPEPTLPPAPQPGDVIISFIFYDGVQENEPDEYAVISNQGAAQADLNGWRLNADDSGQDFWFQSLVLGPGQSCRVYTNMVTPESCEGRSFGNDQPLWANSGECGHLFDNNGVEVSTYCY